MYTLVNKKKKKLDTKKYNTWNSSEKQQENHRKRQKKEHICYIINYKYPFLNYHVHMAIYKRTKYIYFKIMNFNVSFCKLKITICREI